MNSKKQRLNRLLSAALVACNVQPESRSWRLAFTIATLEGRPGSGYWVHCTATELGQYQSMLSCRRTVIRASAKLVRLGILETQESGGNQKARRLAWHRIEQLATAAV